jgi:hypothetical protein
MSNSADSIKDLQLTLSGIIQDIARVALLNSAYRSVVLQHSPELQPHVDALLTADHFVAAKIRCDELRKVAVQAVLHQDLPLIVGAIGEVQGTASRAANQQVESPGNPK